MAKGNISLKKFVLAVALFLAAACICFNAYAAQTRKTIYDSFSRLKLIAAQYKYSGETLIDGMHARLLPVPGIGMEDAKMQVSYQLARRSVAKVAVKDSVGSGIVLKVDDDNIVVVSNRHLLMNDIKAEVTFLNGERADAEIIGYSQQYDIGFLKVSGKDVSARILRDIYEAVPAEYAALAAQSFNDEYADRPVLQIGADLSGNGDNYFTGNILGIGYEPVFNTDVLKTKCYAKAGMSGGGVFDAGGRFLGMLSGGEVDSVSTVKEADVSYSIPVALIEEEYREVSSGKAGE